jgi:sortase B
MNMKKKKVIALVTLLLGMGVAAYAGFNLLAADQVYQEGNAAYDAISSRVRGGVESSLPASKEHLQAQGNTAQGNIASSLKNESAQIYIPEAGINFDVLNSINEAAAAWLYCPDTVIDYPVMQADNYSYYLNHLPDGTQNANGTLFIDYNCASDFSDPLTVIYGHHMKSGRMFGGLKGYKTQKYYEEHPFMYLYTEHGDYRIDLMYGCVIGAGQWRERAFMFPENVGALLSYASINTTFSSNTEYAEGDRVVALSTCSYEFDNARYVVIGILRGD